ncbi:MAG: hypothetical protein LC750_07495 [Actinobacteria bacterium]|nr:hypothetical protein [Actinomycetota bacterium]
MTADLELYNPVTAASFIPMEFDAIASVVAQRRVGDSAIIRAMKDIRDRYNRDIVVPIPDADVTRSPITPNLIADGIDHTAMRAASVMPSITCPPVDVSSARSRERAAKRRRMLYGVWDRSSVMETMLYRAFRQFIAYGTTAMVCVPDYQTGHARFEVRDPLGTYASPRAGFDDNNPCDVAFVYGRSWSYISNRYPEKAARYMKVSMMGRRPNQTFDAGRLFDMVEWIDEHEVVIGILGPRTLDNAPSYDSFYSENNIAMEFSRYPNRAGMVPAVVPKRITLDRVMGQMAGILGMADYMDKLQILDVEAAERAVFPDFVVYGQDPELVSGSWHDGRSGEANIVKGGEVRVLQSSPGPLTHPVIDRLMEGQRITGGIPPQFGGQIPTGIRTGRANDSTLSAAVDMRIQEAQRVMARGLRTLNAAAIGIEKATWPNAIKSWFISWPGESGTASYVPSRDLETPHSVVSYLYAGADVNSLGVDLLQLTGADIMPVEMAQEAHPLIPDAQLAREMLVVQKLRNAAMEGLLQSVVSGQTPIGDVIEMTNVVLKGASFEEAWKAAQEAAQRRQVIAAPPGAPETQPGMENPASGGQQPAGEQPGGLAPNQAGFPPQALGNPLPVPPQSLQNLSMLNRALRTTGRPA